TRKQPKPEEPMELDPQIRVIAPPGGVLLFSAAQMHSSVPNSSGRTRFSIDFRTVHIDDVRSRRGAPNVDAASTGTCMGDYLRGTDLARVPEVSTPFTRPSPHFLLQFKANSRNSKWFRRFTNDHKDRSREESGANSGGAAQNARPP